MDYDDPRFGGLRIRNETKAKITPDYTELDRELKKQEFEYMMKVKYIKATAKRIKEEYSKGELEKRIVMGQWWADREVKLYKLKQERFIRRVRQALIYFNYKLKLNK